MINLDVEYISKKRFGNGKKFDINCRLISNFFPFPNLFFEIYSTSKFIINQIYPYTLNNLYFQIKFSILIVDDDKDIIQFINVNLKQEGFKVFSAHNGEPSCFKFTLIN
jgi:hypothetical protein